MLMRIDAASETPIYAQIANAVRVEVALGRASAGDRLPAARDVASALNVNLNTVLKGYQALRDEGLVDLRRGRGAVITDAAGRFTDLNNDIENLSRRAKELGVPAASVIAMVRGALGVS